MRLDNNQRAFFALLSAGLWEQEAWLLPYGQIDYLQVLSLSEQQSVVGLIAAGIERVEDTRVPKTDVLQFIGQSLQLEKQNIAMNCFIGVLVDRLREAGIYTLLVKGQGIAQCYAKPLWRSCGDIDLFLNYVNYRKAISFLAPMAQSIDEENQDNLHLAMTIEPWVVELHGSLRCGLGHRIDKVIDAIQEVTFKDSVVRTWRINGSDVYLPAPNNDVVFVFTHILQHFFKGGIGLRQICDLCRLLYTYRCDIDEKLLRTRLCKMRLMSEWKVFAALAVDYLGMPISAWPLYAPGKKWSRKGEAALSLIMEKGNFGHNRDMSYIKEDNYFVRKVKSFVCLIKDSLKRFTIFPIDSFRVLNLRIISGISMLIRGK